METIQPTRDIVLIEADEVAEKTSSGFFLQEQWKTLPLKGVVKAVGPDVKEVKAGDRVLFMRYAAVILDDNDRLVKEAHILAGLH